MIRASSVALLLWTSLVTATGANAQPLPRPEFPQPQFERQDWLPLNGPWEFEFDDDNVGLDEGWALGAAPGAARPARPFSRTVVVPFAFEWPMSGIGDTRFHPWVWYRRSVTVPERWKGHRVLLKFGAVDYRAMVWVNGQLVGQHEGGQAPFSFDITRSLAGGANTIVVRAEDPPTDRAIPRGKQFWEEKSRGIFYTRTTGIWQPVWLEAVGDGFLDSVRIRPSNDGLVTFDAVVVRGRPGDVLSATISRGDTVVASAESSLSGSVARLASIVPSPQLWAVGRPNLYDVTFELRRGTAVLDRVRSYYGYRSVSASQGRVLINNRPTYLKTVLDQGYWPQSGLTPPSDAAIQADIEATLAMGFNGARKHQKVEDPRYLYWADRKGFLVSAEIGNAYVFDEQYAARFTREWMEVVARDANHPSVIMWIPINESWGTPDLSVPQQQQHLKSLYALTRALDPSRLVTDNDGWEHLDTTDLFGLHDYARTGGELLERYRDLGKPSVPVPANARAALAPGFTYNGAPFWLSEFGGIAYIAPNSNVPKDAWGYSGVEPDEAAALARLRGLYEALAKLPAFAGICYTQLTDVEQEINGLLTYDRRPKFEASSIKALNDLLK